MHKEQCKSAAIFQILKGQTVLETYRMAFTTSVTCVTEPSHILQVFAGTVSWHICRMQLYFSLFCDRKVNICIINVSFKASIQYL